MKRTREDDTPFSLIKREENGVYQAKEEEWQYVRLLLSTLTEIQNITWRDYGLYIPNELMCLIKRFMVDLHLYRCVMFTEPKIVYMRRGLSSLTHEYLPHFHVFTHYIAGDKRGQFSHEADPIRCLLETNHTDKLKFVFTKAHLNSFHTLMDSLFSSVSK